MGNEGAHEADLIGVAELVRGQSDQQHGDMRAGAVVSDTGQAANAGFLDGNGQ